MSGETAVEKAQRIGRDFGKTLDRAMRDALERANKFNLDNDLFDSPEDAITYDLLEDVLDDHGLGTVTGTFRAFVEDQGDGSTYDADAVVKW